MRNIIFFLGAAALVMPAPAFADSTAEGSAQITARVPEVCEISAGLFSLAADGSLEGTVNEFCNTAFGYQILAMYRPLEGGESATVSYAASSTALDRSGSSVVASRSGQRVETVPVTVEARNINTPLSVAFTLVAV